MISDATWDQPPGLEPISIKEVLFDINLNFLLSSMSLKADLER